MLWKQFCLGKNLPTHIRENKIFSAKASAVAECWSEFQRLLMVKDYMALILLLYCIKSLVIDENGISKGSVKVLAASYLD